MKVQIAGAGETVIDASRYCVMEHYQEMERFLLECGQGKKGEVVLYKVCRDGAVSRQKFYYDGTDMYLSTARVTWRGKSTPVISDVTHMEIETWNYTEKGWFCYELSVPKPPEVTEIVDGSCMVRVRPLSNECLAWSEKCVLPLGYQGNNLLCSNWDAAHMEGLDYNAIYEYLYAMKYRERFEPENSSFSGINEEKYFTQVDVGGASNYRIPAAEFEGLLMEYLPVTAEQLRRWAVFDEESQTYAWARMGCMNVSPTVFSTSLPEVVRVEENGDGTITLTVDAVCDMTMCNDAVITHQLMIRCREDGSFQYLGNQILNDGVLNIPEYQYRLR